MFLKQGLTFYGQVDGIACSFTLGIGSYTLVMAAFFLGYSLQYQTLVTYYHTVLNAVLQFLALKK